MSVKDRVLLVVAIAILVIVGIAFARRAQAETQCCEAFHCIELARGEWIIRDSEYPKGWKVESIDGLNTVIFTRGTDTRGIDNIAVSSDDRWYMGIQSNFPMCLMIPKFEFVGF